MTELDLIRSFRADVPPPTAAATARAERAWRPPRRRRPRWLARVAVAACLVAGATAAALLLPAERDGRLGAPDARAAQTLKLAAAAEEGGLPRPLRPGEHWYVRRRTAWTMSMGDEYSLIQPQLREDWVGVDGSRRWVTRPEGPPRFPSEEDRERWEADGRRLAGLGRVHEHSARAPFYIGNRHLTYDELLALPRDASALYRYLRTAAEECECGSSVEQETFVIVGDLLRDAPIPVELRAALLRAAAHIPGIELVETEHDLAGREGVGVAFDADGERDVLIFDRETHELLGETVRAGTPLVGGSVDVESGIVDSPTARP